MDTIEQMVKDFTSVHPRPKSEVRKRILEYAKSRNTVADNTFETCSSCGKKDDTVRERNCGYARDVNNNPNRAETVCDACEHEHLMDI